MLKAHARDLQKFNEQQLDGLRESMAKHQDDAMRRYQAEMAQFRDEQLAEISKLTLDGFDEGEDTEDEDWGTGRILPGGRGSMRDCRRIRTSGWGPRTARNWFCFPVGPRRRRCWWRVVAARVRHPAASIADGGRRSVGPRPRATPRSCVR